jgi:hypothetical protein
MSTDKAKPVHPHLENQSISFAGPRYERYDWKTIFSKHSKRSKDEALILHDVFGISGRATSPSHALLGQYFRREWVDADGLWHGVDGTISECFQANQKLFFTVDLDKTCVQMINMISASKASVPEQLRNVGIADARGGFICYRQCYSLPCNDAGGEPMHIWRVPNRVVNKSIGDLPVRTLVGKGWVLTLQVKRSEEIGGLGCYLTWDSTAPSTKHLPHFILRPGEFIDLGVYARPEDCVPLQLFQCKNFILSHEAEKFTFEVQDNDDAYLFDINDNVLANKLNEAAQRNVLPYVNETDGHEAPCVTAERDPAGQVCIDSKVYVELW